MALQYRAPVSKAGINVVFLVDSSGSMMKDQQIAFIKGLIHQTLTLHKNKRLKYAAVALSNGDAELVSALTTDTSALIQQIAQLNTGGKTNMKAGFELVRQLLHQQDKTKLYLFTDGKINAGDTEQPFAEAVLYFQRFLAAIKETIVIDNESGFVKLGLSAKLAKAIGAKHIQLTDNLYAI